MGDGRSSSWSCPVAGLGIGGADPSGSAAFKNLT
jgi:hypothetical protein